MSTTQIKFFSKVNFHTEFHFLVPYCSPSTVNTVITFDILMTSSRKFTRTEFVPLESYSNHVQLNVSIHLKII
jgi:hypothetical protein